MQTDRAAITALCYLIACALHGETPDETRLSGIDPSELYVLAKRHSLSAITYMALQGTAFLQNADPLVIGRWRESKEKAVGKNVMLDTERKQILAELEKKKIWYMPLKGSLLKFFYPREGMREMADNDILFDGSFRKEVRDVFESRGYQTRQYARGNHDAYIKAPVYNFEMHVSLFAEFTCPELSGYFGRIEEKLLPDSDSVCGRHLCDEDFYLYAIAHSYKHHSNCGTGLRTLVDAYVMNEHFGSTLDRAVLDAELRKLHLEAYEKHTVSLARRLFGCAASVDLSVLPQEERDIFECCISAGTYGTTETHVKNALAKDAENNPASAKRAKRRYILKRLFPGRKWFKTPYPFFYHVPVLIPFFWIYRIFRTLFSGKQRIKNEINAVRNAD